MRIIALKTLKDFYFKHQDAEQSLKAWYYEVKEENWKTSHDIKINIKQLVFLLRIE